jgi:hypothetical protein
MSHPRTGVSLTLTNEPFQPVRLYYSIPDRARESKILRGLECTVQAPEKHGWRWLFHAETASLRFAGGFDDVPTERRPIVLGRIRFPERRVFGMKQKVIFSALRSTGIRKNFYRFYCQLISLQLSIKMSGGGTGENHPHSNRKL